MHDYSNLKSMYHFREFELAKLKLIKDKLDVFVSHEWPTVATSRLSKHDRQLSALLKIKPYFKAEVSQGDLGSRNLSDVLDALQPRYWFSAHLHCHFNALILTKDGVVEFQALDKPIPRRKYLDVYEITPRGDTHNPLH